jgi:hypothetical protein
LNPCKPNPFTNLTICGQYGTCYTKTNLDQTGLDYICHCMRGYSGRNCQETSSFCNKMPCLNGASCIDISPTKFQCVCKSSYTGNFCEQLINPCTSTSSITPLCSNNGQCMPTSGKNYTCLCPPGYAGQYCEKFLNPCYPNPCVAAHTQSCQVYTLQTGAQASKCVCKLGYTGKKTVFQKR